LNGLNKGKAWLEIIALLKCNTLELKSLDLSSNRLALKEDDYDSNIMVSSLGADEEHISPESRSFWQ
jgi:hypothetical protein